jgi:hypothetical protein
MPVQKFRTIDEMNRASTLRRGDATFDRFLRHCARYRTLARKTYSGGVFRFRTLAEAQRAREQADGA